MSIEEKLEELRKELTRQDADFARFARTLEGLGDEVVMQVSQETLDELAELTTPRIKAPPIPGCALRV